MIGNPKTDALEHATISGVVFEGFTCKGKDGRTLRMALVDEEGNVVEAGPAVAREAWNVCIKVQKNFWKGEGHMRVINGQIEELESIDVPFGFAQKDQAA